MGTFSHWPLYVKISAFFTFGLALTLSQLGILELFSSTPEKVRIQRLRGANVIRKLVKGLPDFERMTEAELDEFFPGRAEARRAREESHIGLARSDIGGFRGEDENLLDLHKVAERS
jgi:hypothetical protein